jgi:predicted ATPase
VQQAREQVERLMVLAVDWAFPFWEALGTVFRGWLEAVCGHIEEGIGLMRQGIATHQAMGLVILYPANLTTLAEAYGKGGKPEEGLQVLPEALRVMTTTGQCHWEAELYRIKGELTLQQSQASLEQVTGKSRTSRKQVQTKPKTSQNKSSTDPQSLTPDPEGEAEACFLKAIEIAQRQQAKSLELRATMSLVRLRQQQTMPSASRNTNHAARNRLDESHQMLAEVYNWFTEGFDTKDLQDAKTLLTQLHGDARAR